MTVKYAMRNHYEQLKVYLFNSLTSDSIRDQAWLWQMFDAAAHVFRPEKIPVITQLALYTQWQLTIKLFTIFYHYANFPHSLQSWPFISVLVFSVTPTDVFSRHFQWGPAWFLENDGCHRHSLSFWLFRSFLLGSFSNTTLLCSICLQYQP